MSARRTADETRELIRSTALRLFRERGHDDSEGSRRTRALIDGAAPVVGRLVPLARLPVVPGAAQDVLRLVAAARA
ncbi:hypothetical protein J1G42_16280 [Cellulomonas sp. zg-ZUI222]|uniref:hypothetical protein n=1 Tax=Cellulomonas wangleii TaxID=2816956 RepID=UPI001A941086|nr:hypothetical protein [Cellulomonas wangleii]MBO0922380.1 hypothetical protein [Cellulomonas wangleii]